MFLIGTGSMRSPLSQRMWVFVGLMMLLSIYSRGYAADYSGSVNRPFDDASIAAEIAAQGELALSMELAKTREAVADRVYWHRQLQLDRLTLELARSDGPCDPGVETYAATQTGKISERP